MFRRHFRATEDRGSWPSRGPDTHGIRPRGSRSKLHHRRIRPARSRFETGRTRRSLAGSRHRIRTLASRDSIRRRGPIGYTPLLSIHELPQALVILVARSKLQKAPGVRPSLGRPVRVEVERRQVGDGLLGIRIELDGPLQVSFGSVEISTHGTGKASIVVSLLKLRILSDHVVERGERFLESLIGDIRHSQPIPESEMVWRPLGGHPEVVHGFLGPARIFVSLADPIDRPLISDSRHIQSTAQLNEILLLAPQVANADE